MPCRAPETSWLHHLQGWIQGSAAQPQTNAREGAVEAEAKAKAKAEVEAEAEAEAEAEENRSVPCR